MDKDKKPFVRRPEVLKKLNTENLQLIERGLLGDLPERFKPVPSRGQSNDLVVAKPTSLLSSCLPIVPDSPPPYSERPSPVEENASPLKKSFSFRDRLRMGFFGKDKEKAKWKTITEEESGVPLPASLPRLKRQVSSESQNKSNKRFWFFRHREIIEKRGKNHTPIYQRSKSFEFLPRLKDEEPEERTKSTLTNSQSYAYGSSDTLDSSNASLDYANVYYDKDNTISLKSIKQLQDSDHNSSLSTASSGLVLNIMKAESVQDLLDEFDKTVDMFSENYLSDCEPYTKTFSELTVREKRRSSSFTTLPSPKILQMNKIDKVSDDFKNELTKMLSVRQSCAGTRTARRGSVTDWFVLDDKVAERQGKMVEVSEMNKYRRAQNKPVKLVRRMSSTKYIESDTDNYMKWRFCGGTLKLKQGAVPTKFDCQKTKRTSTTTRPGYDKRQRIDFYENLLTKEVRPSVVQQDTEFISVENAPVNLDEPINPLPIDNTTIKAPNMETKKTKNKRIQVEQETKDAQSQTTKKRENIKTLSRNLDTSFSSDEKVGSDSSDSESLYYSDSIETCEIHLNSLKNTILKIESNSKLYLGIHKQSYFVINLLTENVRCPLVNILITLKKIKLNDSYQRLEIDFNTKNVSRIIRKTVVLLAKCFKQLIYFPTKEDVKEKLPIPFRRRYNNTVCIIDCFEISIEKPSNALHQALSWSQYKGCNTIKYLISITPDGTINFVSDGYGGRATDADIFEDCQILERMPKGSAIMADRGFKNIASDVQMHGCHLVRPPSVSMIKASTKKEVIETKRIASLRIHVERAIGRIREFKLTSPHACIDTKVIDMLDDVVIISCGLVNIQSKLV